MRHLLFALGVLLMIGCSSARKATGKDATADIKNLKLINEYIYPNEIAFKNTIIGGLSGIDYDQSRDVYYMICDDPSTKGPARFYTANC